MASHTMTPPCFLTWQANDLVGNLSCSAFGYGHLLLGYSNVKFQYFTIEKAQNTFMASPIHFLLILLFKFFEHDMIGNFNGTVSNMK